MSWKLAVCGNAGHCWTSNRGELPPQPAAFAVIDERLRHPFGRGLDRGQQRKQREQRAEHPPGQIERASRQEKRTTAKQFENCARFSAACFGEPRRSRNVLRAFGDLQRVERTARTGLLANAPDVLGEPNQPTSLLGAEGGGNRADGLRRARDCGG